MDYKDQEFVSIHKILVMSCNTKHLRYIDSHWHLKYSSLNKISVGLGIEKLLIFPKVSRGFPIFHLWDFYNTCMGLSEKLKLLPRQLLQWDKLTTSCSDLSHSVKPSSTSQPILHFKQCSLLLIAKIIQMKCLMLCSN